MGCQVPDWKAATRSSIEQTLPFGKVCPFQRTALTIAAPERIVKDYQGKQVKNKWNTETTFIARGIREDSGPDNFIENLPVDTHKVRLYVKLQHIARTSVILRAGTYVMFQTAHPKTIPLAHAARIAVMYESTFKHRHQPIAEEVMHNPVPKRGSEDLPVHRILNHKTNASTNPVMSTQQIIIETHQIIGKISLESNLGRGIPLILSGAVISSEKVRQQYFFPLMLGGNGLNSRLTGCCCS